MKKWLCVIAVIAIAGCQKGIDLSDAGGTGTGGGNTNSIVGTWKFDSATVSSESISEYTDMDSVFKSITYFNYNSQNNSGSVVFNANSICSSHGIGYSVDDTAYAYDYENGVLLDSSAPSFSYTVDTSSVTRSYTVIGNDSLYFPQGFISTSLSGAVQAPAGGGKFSISGNTLTITQSIYQDTTLVSADIPYHSIISAKSVLVLTKQ